MEEVGLQLGTEAQVDLYRQKESHSTWEESTTSKHTNRRILGQQGDQLEWSVDGEVSGCLEVVPDSRCI